MSLKKVAIVGRPNVGKSQLFNAIVKKRISIVDEDEGTTRDRIYARAEFFGYPFELIDTGGIDMRSKADFVKEIKQQAEIAIQEADSIIMVVDGRVELQLLDQEVAQMLHQSKKPITLAVNKLDNDTSEKMIAPFRALGFTNIVPTSAIHTLHMAELLESALETFDKADIPKDPPGLFKIAIVGRPNVGKSHLLNTLLGHERSVVSPIAGTTRDAIDTTVKFKDQEYLFIDTAGIRRTAKEKEVVEKFASIRTQEALERCDLALMVIDAGMGLTQEEKKIIHQIEEAGKACILLINKWDLAKGFRMEHAFQALDMQVPFLEHVPKLIISAKTGRNVEKIFPSIAYIRAAYEKRITTGTLNKCLVTAMQLYHPPFIGGKRLRVYYLAQIDTRPPRFVLFVNSPLLMDHGYKKYLINQIRKEFDFNGVPLVLELRGKLQNRRKPPAPTKTSREHDRDLHHIGRPEDMDD